MLPIVCAEVESEILAVAILLLLGASLEVASSRRRCVGTLRRSGACSAASSSPGHLVVTCIEIILPLEVLFVFKLIFVIVEVFFFWVVVLVAVFAVLVMMALCTRRVAPDDLHAFVIESLVDKAANSYIDETIIMALNGKLLDSAVFNSVVVAHHHEVLNDSFAALTAQTVVVTLKDGV